MIDTTLSTLDEFIGVLGELSDEAYIHRCRLIGDATVGQHVRHTIELYQCLLSGYQAGEVCYDKRKRDIRIETNIQTALNCLVSIKNELNRPDKSLSVFYELNSRQVELQSNYYREIMYNLEHTIHHQALIRVAIESSTNILLPTTFGVAPSTTKYRLACAQ